MIKAKFKLGGDIVEVIIRNNELLFMDIGTGTIAPLTEKTMRLSKAGVLKEHPDLKDEIEWRKIALERLKTHMNKMKTEMQKITYVKDELIKFGYDCLHYQKAGFRPKKF